MKNELNIAKLTALLDETAAGFGAVGLLNEKHQAEQLKARLGQNKEAMVVVIGEFNAGKSTLVNALCGTALLPVGVVPTTATINIVSHSEQPRILIVHWDGRETLLRFDSDVLQRFTARNGDQSDIREVRIQVPSAPKGLVLVDTPGVNDINQTRAEVVYEAIPKAHALIFVMDIEQPLKRSEVEFLRERVLGSSLAKTLYVLNFTDRLANVAEIDLVVKSVRASIALIYQEVASRFVRSGATAIAEMVKNRARDIPVFPVSAKMKLRSENGRSAGNHQSEFWNWVIHFGEPLERNATLVNGVQAQTAVLLLQLRQAVADRIAMQGATQSRLRAMALCDGQALLKSAKACESALAKLKSARTQLISDAERSIAQIFEKAATSFDAKVSQYGFERAFELTQQEVGRELEARVELLNQSVQQIAKECCANASAFIPIIYDQSAIGTVAVDSQPLVQQRKAIETLRELINDPVNQIGILVAGLLSVPVGLAVVAFRVIACLFGGSPTQTPVNLPKRLREAADQLKIGIAAALSQRFDSIAVAITDVLDEPQQRIRSTCKALSGDDGGNRVDEQWLRRVTALLADCAGIIDSTTNAEGKSV